MPLPSVPPSPQPRRSSARPVSGVRAIASRALPAHRGRIDMHSEGSLDAARTLSIVEARRERATDCLVVASGKGGVGTSVIASLAALAAVERGDKVLLVDASEASGALHHLFGVRPTHSLWMLTDAAANSRDLIIHVDEALSLIAGGTSGTAVAPPSDFDRRAALDRLAGLYSEFDTIVFDAGSRLETISAITDLTDAAVLLVSAADRLTLAANYALVKAVLAARESVPISVVASRQSESLADEACGFLVGACSHFLGRAIEVGGFVPDDAGLHAAVGAGLTIRDALEGSSAAEAMRGVLSRVLPSSRTALHPVATTGFSPSLRRWS